MQQDAIVLEFAPPPCGHERRDYQCFICEEYIGRLEGFLDILEEHLAEREEEEYSETDRG